MDDRKPMDRRKNDLLDRTISPVGRALRIPQSDLSGFYTPSLRIYLFETVLKLALAKCVVAKAIMDVAQSYHHDSESFYESFS